VLAAAVPERVWVTSVLASAWKRTFPHHHCSMCGMTRSFSALAHGDLPSAHAYNENGPVIFLAFGVCALLPLALVVTKWFRSQCRTTHRSPQADRLPARTLGSREG